VSLQIKLNESARRLVDAELSKVDGSPIWVAEPARFAAPRARAATKSRIPSHHPVTYSKFEKSPKHLNLIPANDRNPFQISRNDLRTIKAAIAVHRLPRDTSRCSAHD